MKRIMISNLEKRLKTERLDKFVWLSIDSTSIQTDLQRSSHPDPKRLLWILFHFLSRYIVLSYKLRCQHGFCMVVLETLSKIQFSIFKIAFNKPLYNKLEKSILRKDLNIVLGLSNIMGNMDGVVTRAINCKLNVHIQCLANINRYQIE